jgi:hypothetical protein
MKGIAMKVKQLVERLQKIDPETEILIKDFNGLIWHAEKDNFVIKDSELIIDTQNINVT